MAAQGSVLVSFFSIILFHFPLPLSLFIFSPDHLTIQLFSVSNCQMITRDWTFLGHCTTHSFNLSSFDLFLGVLLFSIIFLEFISTKSLPAPFPSEKSFKLPFILGSSFSESSTYILGLDRPPKSGSSSLTSSG